MEALSNLGIDGKLLVAQAINFLVLLYILKRFAYLPMLEFLEKRTVRIEQGLKDAEAAREKLKSVGEEEKRVLEEARKEARKLLEEAEVSAKKRDAVRLTETEAQVARLLSEAESRIRDEKERLLSEAKKEIAGTVALALEKILKEKVDSEKDQELIARAIK